MIDNNINYFIPLAKNNQVINQILTTMNKICRNTYNNESLSQDDFLCNCRDSCEDSLDEDENDAEYYKLKKFERDINEGTDIYPDSFY